MLQRPRKRSNPEGAIVLQIIKSLRARGYEAYKIKTQGSPYKGRFIFDPYRLTGLPDILAWKKEAGDTWVKELFALEVKSKVGVQSSNQKFFESIFHFPPSRNYAVVRSVEEALKAVKFQD
jgi:hypothetical protein